MNASAHSEEAETDAAAILEAEVEDRAGWQGVAQQRKGTVDRGGNCHAVPLANFILIESDRIWNPTGGNRTPIQIVPSPLSRYHAV